MRDSNVTLGDRVVAGGDGWADEFVGYDGQPGLLGLGSCVVTIVADRASREARMNGEMPFPQDSDGDVAATPRSAPLRR